MAIGKITSPTTWTVGMVHPPTWDQNVQDNINGLIDGTGPTLTSLQVDGVGGATSATPAGNIAASGTITGNILSSATSISSTTGIVAGTTLSASGSAGGTSAPTPAFTKGSIYRECAPLAIAAISSGGALNWGVNIASVSLSGSAGTRLYTVTLNTAASSTTKMVAIATSHVDAVICSATVVSTSSITIRSLLDSSTPQDAAFFLLVFGD